MLNYKSNLQYLVDLNGDNVGWHDDEINAKNIWEAFSKPKISYLLAQKHVEQLTVMLLKKNNIQRNSNFSILLLPILRAGMAMWPAANAYFANSETCFVSCCKTKGTNIVKRYWCGLPELEKKCIIFLDTVVATGDTVLAVYNDLIKFNRRPLDNIKLLSCYMSPLAIIKLKTSAKFNQIVTAVISKTVNDQGYLIPKINGDAGDKLFGIKKECQSDL